MVDLEEVIEFELCDILKDSLVMNVPLLQLNLDTLRVIIVLVDIYETFLNLVSHRGYSNRKTAEAVFDFVKDVK